VKLLTVFLPIILVLGVLALIAALLNAARNRSSSEQTSGICYELEPALLNASELWVFQTLERLIPESWRVCPKVRMEDVIRVAAGQDASTRASGRGRVKSRHFDFVLIDESARPVAVVEFDGPHHARSARAQRADSFKNDACRAVGLPLIRINPNDSEGRIGTKLDEALGG